MKQISFREKVYKEMRNIPIGYVVSYSQLAVLCGTPGAARVVGQIAHFGPPDLPWHRVVNVRGGMANGFVPGGPTHQKQLLEAEGVLFDGEKVRMSICQLR